MIETVQVTDRTAIPWTKKINPVWWLQGPDGWTVPDTNNGAPYLPEVKNIWLRRFYWFVCRNPLMNFVGFVLGIEDRNYKAVGSAPVMATTGRDVTPPIMGWRWAVLFPKFGLVELIIAIVLFVLSWFISALLWPFFLFWALKVAGPLPYVSFYNGSVEFYTGWRPYSGGFGTKLVFPKGGA